jgi:sulfate permease, SulP family
VGERGSPTRRRGACRLSRPGRTVVAEAAGRAIRRARALWTWARERSASPPWADLRGVDRRTLRREILPAIAVGMLSVPQGLAYAVIAGLPPVMGLYAGALPAVVGSFLRSSRTVIVGPSNAVSLLVATSVISQMADPVAAAGTLALMVGVMQIAAGALRLDALVEYISRSVVTGYITGAATLIVVGQLPNVTGTLPSGGDILSRLGHWLATLPLVDPVAVLVAGLGVAGILVLRRWWPRGLPSLAVIAGSIAASWALDLRVDTVADIAPIPASLPPLGLPAVHHVWELLPVAVATMVLSLVESSSVSRTLADRSGQRIRVGWDFAGLGAANVAAAVTGAYPVSGSLARSAMNFGLGARTRVAGILAGLLVLAMPAVVGPVLDHTPVATLAAVILLIAADLVDPVAIRALLRSGLADRFAFLGTVLGTWVLPLDEAIYLGVVISLVLFLRRVRLLVIRELWIDTRLRLYEVEADRPAPPGVRCRAVRVLHVEGPLFFGSASELDAALTERIDDPDVQVLVVRMKRAQGLDYTVGAVLQRAHDLMKDKGGHLMLVGMRQGMMQRLEDLGVADVFTARDLYPTAPGWFTAMNQALADALALVDRDRCGDGPCKDCPLARYVERWDLTPTTRR